MTNRTFFWTVTALAVVLAALPFLLGSAMAPRGSQFVGSYKIAYGDASVYYSYIEQGRHGHIIMYDAFTSEHYRPTLWQPVWFVVGQMANVFHVTTPVAYFLARVLALPALLGTLWWAARWLWADRLRQRLALVLGTFAGGLGSWATLVAHQAIYANGGVGPIDGWVAEGYTMLSAATTAHFLLVSAGIIFVLVSVERSWEERSWRRALWAGAVASITLSIHPFHVLTWTLLWSLLTYFRWLTTRKFPGRYLATWLLVLAMCIPPLTMYGLQLFFDPVTYGRAAQNILPTPPAWNVLLSLGLLVPGAIIGVWWTRRRGARWQWLTAWAGIMLIAIYLPVTFQRRLSQAIVIPFSLLSVPVVAWLWLHWRRGVWRILFGFGMLLFLCLSWLTTYQSVVYDYANQTPNQQLLYYLPKQYQDLITIIKTTTSPHEPILSTLLDGNIIAGFTAHQVWVGYGVETLNYHYKMAAMEYFYSRASMSEQRQLLQASGVCYVLDGPRERAYGTAWQPTAWSDISVAWSGQGMTLYHWNGCQPQAT